MALENYMNYMALENLWEGAAPPRSNAPASRNIGITSYPPPPTSPLSKILNPPLTFNIAFVASV